MLSRQKVSRQTCTRQKCTRRTCTRQNVTEPLPAVSPLLDPSLPTFPPWFTQIQPQESPSHVGAVLQQEVAGSWAPLSFYSRKLSSAESRYSAFDRELLAAYSNLQHFQFLLEGNEFVLFSHHNSLTHALFRTTPPWSAMQQRRLSYISKFNCKIIHLPGAENVVADALSQPVSPSSAPSSISQGPVKASSTPNPETNPSHSPPQPAPVGSLVPEVSVVLEVTEQMVSFPPSPSPAGSPPQPPQSVPGISYQCQFFNSPIQRFKISAFPPP